MPAFVYSFQTIVLLFVPACWVVAFQNPTMLAVIFAALSTVAAGGSAGALHALYSDLRGVPQAWMTISAWTIVGCIASVLVAVAGVSPPGSDSRFAFLGSAACGLASFALFCFTAYIVQIVLAGSGPEVTVPDGPRWRS